MGAQFADFAEFTGFVDVLDQLVGFAVEHLVAAVHGVERECLGDVALAGTGFANQ